MVLIHLNQGILILFFPSPYLIRMMNNDDDDNFHEITMEHK